MNRVKEVARINARDVSVQLASDSTGNARQWDVSKSWHAQYSNSAYVYVGGLPLDLSEGDVVIVFSQFGEVVDINIPRDHKTGKSRGFAFIGYEDQRSTVLAVDNFNGAKLLGRTLRCDHCASYHEEQKKEMKDLPEHVVRRMSEKEIEQKQKDLERRNQELEEDSTVKASTFASGRGTFESEEQTEEREIREQIVHVRLLHASLPVEYAEAQEKHRMTRLYACRRKWTAAQIPSACSTSRPCSRSAKLRQALRPRKRHASSKHGRSES